MSPSGNCFSKHYSEDYLACKLSSAEEYSVDMFLVGTIVEERCSVVAVLTRRACIRVSRSHHRRRLVVRVGLVLLTFW